MFLKNRKIYKFKNFNLIQKFINKFKITSFNQKNKVDAYSKFFELGELIKEISDDKIKNNLPEHLINVEKKNKRPLTFELNDLCRLHWLVLARKALNTLEFGSGFSTLFIADSCLILKKFFKDVENLRVEKKFHVYSLEESKKFINITKKRLFLDLKKHVTLINSKHKIINYQGKYATQCLNVPNISPDLIYLDGPSQYISKKNFNGFNFNTISRFPMSADLLLLEYFFEPGTFIIVDGRTSNARFLKDHFKRNWKYFHDTSADCHYFELNEKPLGKYNKLKLKFCLGK